MATVDIHSIGLNISGVDVAIEYYDTPIPTEPMYFRVLHDWEFAESGHRTKVPEVYTLDDRSITMTAAIQELSYGLFRWGAPSLPEDLARKRWTSLYHTAKAFANQKGFGGVEPRMNFITMEDIGAPLPELDKHRFCGGATIKGKIERGHEYYNYITKRKEINDVVWIETIDPDDLPTLSELIQKPWLYFHATVAYKQRGGMFPNGTQPELDIWEPTLVPLLSRFPVFWPLKYLEPVYYIADPYKFSNPPVSG